MKTDLEEIRIKRDYKVVKANALIQRARYDLTIAELKILAYLFSMVKPNDGIGTTYEISFSDFSRICGMQYRSGKAYNDIKKSLKSIGDKSFWVLEEDGDEVLTRWIDKVELSRAHGRAVIRFDPTIEKYIHGLFRDFTEYTLLSTLPMKCIYSFRIYEMLKSYAFTKQHHFEIDDFKKLLNAESYVRFPDFRRKVIEPAIREINLYTDLAVSCEPELKGRKVIGLTFYIEKRDMWEQALARQRATDKLDGVQMTIEDFLGPFDGNGKAMNE